MRLQAAASGAGCSPSDRLLLPPPLRKSQSLLVTNQLLQEPKGTRRVRHQPERLHIGIIGNVGTMRIT